MRGFGNHPSSEVEGERGGAALVGVGECALRVVVEIIAVQTAFGRVEVIGLLSGKVLAMCGRLEGASRRCV